MAPKRFGAMTVNSILLTAFWAHEFQEGIESHLNDQLFSHIS